MLRIFITGGTFDKTYNYISGELTFFETHVNGMLKRGRCSLDIEVETLMMKDSLQMTDADRQLIAESCNRVSESRMVITHGTDTMVETAAYLSKHVKDKTVILTGAMIPYTFGTSSDGFFNMGAALAFAQTLNPGIYVAMNGRYFDWNNVRKNYTTGYFETINSLS